VCEPGYETDLVALVSNGSMVPHSAAG